VYVCVCERERVCVREYLCVCVCVRVDEKDILCVCERECVLPVAPLSLSVIGIA
jgi:hypothetical protein